MALSLLQQIKSECLYRKTDNPFTIQYHHCMAKTGNMAHVDCRIYIISGGRIMEQSIPRLILNDNHSANRADELI